MKITFINPDLRGFELRILEKDLQRGLMGKDAEVFKLVANDGESLLNEIYTVHNTDTFGNDKVLKIKLLGNKRLGIRREKYRAYITCLDI